jgi:uncharacterized protein (TIGR02646 family)
MKYIVKNQEPQDFINWKNQANEDWQPTYNNLQNPQKEIVFQSLLEEQGYICCYCERELRNNDYHIEHFKPKDQNLFPELQLEYSNLLCSCQRNTQKGEPLHCGNAKDNWFDDNSLISPLNPNCEAKFIYTGDGHIKASDINDSSAVTTIEKLKLDIDKLVDLRNKAIEPFIDESLNDDDLRNFVNGYLVEKEDNSGKYNEFFTTIKYLFEN